MPKIFIKQDVGRSRTLRRGAVVDLSANVIRRISAQIGHKHWYESPTGELRDENNAPVEVPKEEATPQEKVETPDTLRVEETSGTESVDDALANLGKAEEAVDGDASDAPETDAPLPPNEFDKGAGEKVQEEKTAPAKNQSTPKKRGRGSKSKTGGNDK